MRKQIDFTITVCSNHFNNEDGVSIEITPALRNWHHIFSEVKSELLTLIDQIIVGKKNDIVFYF